MLASSVPTRRVLPETEAAVRDVGTSLFEATFRGAVAVAYRASLAIASEHGANGVQLVLRLTAPGLAALPWETMYDSETMTYICSSEPLVRRVSAPYTPDALAITPPLRVLGMVASPRGLPTLDVTAERERLEDAMRPHLESGRVELDWLEDVSWDGLHASCLKGSGTCSTSSATAATTPRRMKACSHSSTRRPRRIHPRVEPCRPAPRGESGSSARRPELVRVRNGERDRPLLRHRRRARAQRHPRRRGDAVSISDRPRSPSRTASTTPSPTAAASTTRSAAAGSASCASAAHTRMGHAVPTCAARIASSTWRRCLPPNPRSPGRSPARS